MLELPEKINFDEVWSLYEGRRPMDVKPSKIEKLNVDKKGVQAKMNAIARKPLDPQEGVIETVDNEASLTFIVKQYLNRRTFDLVMRRVKSGHEDMSAHAVGEAKTPGNRVCGLEFLDKGNMFDMVDRWTPGKFRRQGFANMVLQAAEGFMQERANDIQRTVISFADVAQLDVICWLYNQGYRPQNMLDAEHLSEVLSGLDGIEIGEGLYIFRDTPKYLQPDFHNAYRIKLVKEIQPKAAAKVVDVQAETQRAIEGVGIENSKNGGTKKFLQTYLGIEQNDAERIQMLKARNFPMHYQAQREFLNDERLDDVTVAIIPDDLWVKGSQPSESHAEKQLILIKQSYFQEPKNPDEIAWLLHELAHCKNLLDSRSPQEYQHNMQTFAFDDLKLEGEYPYPNNPVEKYAFSKQFEYLKKQGKSRGDILGLLTRHYSEKDMPFFSRLLDEIYD